MQKSTRKKKILKKIDLGGEGLEIGPLCWPVVLKKESKIFYVDHASTTELRKKYAHEKVPVNEIVSVDYVLHNKTLSEVTKGKKFDYVIASHVIEHIPDTIRWLQDISSILKTNGKLSLVIPDKRFTFDINRNVSRSSDVIGSYIDQLKKPSSSMMFDFAKEYVKDVIPEKIWQGEKINYTKINHRYNLRESLEMTINNRKPKTYVDSHCHVYTSESFFNILKDIVKLKLIDFSVDYYCNTSPGEYEFFVTLTKNPSKTVDSLIATIPNIKRSLTSEEMNTKIKLLEDNLNAINNSKSWKITKPIRQLNRLVKKLI